MSNERLQRSDHEFRAALSPTAIKASSIISNIRSEELKSTWSTSATPSLNPEELFPGMMFNIAKPALESTKLWKIIQKMPKGALLHCHLGAMVDLEKFLQKFFTTLVADEVRWVEFRSAPFTAFTVEKAEKASDDPDVLLGVLNEEIEKFKSSDAGRGFWGARMIWASLRFWPTEKIIQDMSHCIRLKKLYPDLISGYDLVGHEDPGRTLESLTPELLWFQEECKTQAVNIPLFLHAGETVGCGTPTDQNLYTAILLRSRRLGHAFSLYKHPLLIDQCKKQNILVESCPISNEVLRYSASIMSHPLPALISRGVKAALSNDDPALLGQGTSGLSHDFWQAIQGWEDLGIEGLGSLAENSIRWAAFEDESEDEWNLGVEKGYESAGVRAKRMEEWKVEWESFY
ncbi:putative Adenosine deaminase CECR1-A [Glarea lozoyensis 74030]|uniref:adenosine deaminase n=1 Tax=Glarea lozoyensis (strain ATCC 74030 / MF5533) TaxID=1104152 RepID=H0ECE7_GLAL7|nr:putative Adenosine deaminase CECR1-A [Glarea lozoyensis 74030]